MRAPLPVVSLRVVPGAGRSVVAGRVLTEKQAREVRRVAAVHGAETKLDVVADPEAGLEEAWVDVAWDGLDVWRSPGEIDDPRARQTIYLREDGPLRRLGRVGDALLIQGPDLTVGWVVSNAVGPDLPSSAARARWDAWRRAQAGAAVEPDPERGDASAAFRRVMVEARAALGTPYVWGGTTWAGYDCSGLVQRVMSRGAGVLLPKHTADQRRVGARVTRGAAGDLLFATPIGHRVGHVMLLTSPESVLHACRTECKVIEEPIEENARRYRHQGFRRPVLLTP